MPPPHRSAGGANLPGRSATRPARRPSRPRRPCHPPIFESSGARAKLFPRGGRCIPVAPRGVLQFLVGLLRLEMKADVLTGLHEIRDLYLLPATVLDLGAGRYRISGYGAEGLIPELKARGCTVQVLMTTAEIDQFHDRVAETVQSPEERA